MKRLFLLLSLCLLCACSQNAPSEAPVPTESSAPAIDVTPLLGKKVQVTETTEAYRLQDGELLPAGSFPAGALLDLSQEAQGDKIALRDSDLLVSGAAVSDSGRYYRIVNHLLPQPLSLTTAESYTLEDEKGHAQYQGNGEAVYDVYLLPAEEDPRYGVLFQNRLLYLPESEVTATSEVSRSEEAGEDLPVLMYHFFYDAAESSPDDGNYLEKEEFREQLQYLQDNGYAALTMKETLYFLQGRALIPEKSVTITIDDGDPSVHTYAYPLLKEYGTNATLFLICGWQPAEMPWELWEMREAGIEMQSHGFLTHQGGCSYGHGGLLTCMDFDEGVEDTIRSFEYCDGGYVYCYPFGDVNEHARSIIETAGAKMAYTTENGKVAPGMDLLTLPRVRISGGEGLEAFAAKIR